MFACYPDSPDFAAQTVQQHAAVALKRGEAATVGRWLDRLGTEVVHAHPLLCVQQAWVWYFANDIDRIAPLLLHAERHLGQRDDEQTSMSSDIAALRAWVAFRQGAFAAAISCFREALAHLPAQAHFQRGVNLMFLGDALQQVGDTRQAAESYAASIPLCREAGNTAAVLGATLKLATACRSLGALPRARAMLQQTFDDVEQSPPPPSIVYLHLGLGDVLYEQNDLDRAAEHIQAGLDLVQRKHTLIHVLPLLLLAHARICQARGDQAGARAALQQADEYPNVLTDARVQALAVLRRVQLWLQRGDLAAPPP
jgi:LuxR family maltose regulon positive regulatory protein